MNKTYKEKFEEIDQRYKVVHDEMNLHKQYMLDLESDIGRLSSDSLVEQQDVYKDKTFEYFVNRAKFFELRRQHFEIQQERIQAYTDWKKYE